MEQETRKFRGQAPRTGRRPSPSRPDQRPREEDALARGRTPRPAALASVIAEVLPRFDAQNPPQDGAELYADLFIDSRRFLMIIRGSSGRWASRSTTRICSASTSSPMATSSASSTRSPRKQGRQSRMIRATGRQRTSTPGVSTWCNFLFDFPDYYARSTVEPEPLRRHGRASTSAAAAAVADEAVQRHHPCRRRHSGACAQALCELPADAAAARQGAGGAARDLVRASTTNSRAPTFPAATSSTPRWRRPITIRRPG